VGTEQREVGRAEPVGGGLGLVPVGVQQRRPADLLQPGQLLVAQRQVGRAEVVDQLVGRAGPDDHRRHRRPGQQPGQRHLGRGGAATLGHLHQGLDDVVQLVLVADRGLVPAGQEPGLLWVRLVAAVLAAQQPAGQGAPDEDAEALVDGDGHQFVLGLTGLQRVVDLLADQPGQAPPLGDAQRLHQLPAGVVGTADIADLTGVDQVVQGLERLLERRTRSAAG